jgi:hypothetical protein
VHTVYVADPDVAFTVTWPEGLGGAGEGLMATMFGATDGANCSALSDPKVPVAGATSVVVLAAVVTV